MKKNFMNALFLMSALVIVSGAVSVGEARVARAPYRTIKVEGTRAEFLFNAMSEFDQVPGLEGTADCAMGTCGTVMKGITCVKTTEGDKFEKDPVVKCSVASVDEKKMIDVSYRDVTAVSRLRRAMIEAIGRQSSTATRNTIYAASIECTAHAINRELDSLEIESNFSCDIQADW